MIVKLVVDLSEFTNFTRKVPGIMDGIVKQSFNRGASKMRKEFIKTIDTGSWAKLQQTAEYRSKYSRPLQVMKSIIRYRVTGGGKRVTANIGVFPGKAGRDTLSNAKFQAKYGVTLNRFAKIMTYGGSLRLRSGDGSRLARQGFYIKKGTRWLKFPKRDWYTQTIWKNPSVIIPYIEKDLNSRIERSIIHGNFYRKIR